MNNIAKLTVSPSSEAFQDYIKRDHPEAVKIKPASHWADELAYSLENPPHQQGDCMPWDKTYSTIRMRPSELSVWAGTNGHGKSSLNCQVLIWLAAQGKRVMIASMEMPPLKTLNRMVRQAAGGASPDRKWQDMFFKRMEGNLWFYDQLGSVDATRCLDVVRYSADRLKCDHIQVDSITKIKGMMGDHSNGLQMDFVNDLQSLAFDYKTHIHLVSHVRKGNDERNAPGKFDLKGSGGIADQADNIYIVWQNKDKLNNPNDPAFDGKPDTVLKCVKQRHGEWEGPVMLWFGAKGAMQFVGREGERLTCPGFSIGDRP